MENNSNTDIDALTKFRPMPKQFMVWDKVGKQFLRKRLPDGIDMVFSIFELPLEIDCLDEEEKKQFIICQSTNLFDKDGKEIFEGSIVKWGVDTGLIELHNGKWTFHVVDSYFDVYHELCPNVDLVKVIGHILSNPKLMEEKDV